MKSANSAPQSLYNSGELLQKGTTGAGERSLKGEPLSLIGSGPVCCCKGTEHHKESCEQMVPVMQRYQLQRQVVSATVLEAFLEALIQECCRQV